MRTNLFFLLFCFVAKLSLAQLTVTSPNGGENWSVGSTQTITWMPAPTGYVDILYTTTGSAPYTLIVSGTPDDGSYTWVVPNTPTTNARIVIRDSNDPFTIDQSNAAFTISTPSLTVTSPNGGENWLVGSNQTITWTTSGTISNVDLLYSTNGGSSYNLIASNISNTGSYNWTVPNVTSNQVRIRVRHSAYPSSIFDDSDNNFTIYQNPVITILQPNGGENLTAGSSYNITWNYSGMSNGEIYELYYSTNGGSSWNFINDGGVNSYYYTWTVPSVNSSQCLIRIVVITLSNVSDTSDAFFTISAPVPNCAINFNPSNNATNVTLSPTLTWSSGGGSPTGYDVYFGTNSNPPLVSSNQSNTSYFPGTLQPNTTYYWRIEPRNSNGVATGCQTLSFTTANSYITVTYPNGGENLTGGSNVNIAWTQNQTSNYFSLYYSTNGGSSWNTISTYLYNTNPNPTYSWNVPNITSSNCLIRIVDSYNSAIADTSNAVFSITGTPPNCAINFNPSNNATNVTLSPTLTWSSGGGSPTGYDVYFGTNSNPPLVSSNQASTSYSTGTLQPNTTYYWRIVPRNANGVATGCQTLSFTTANPTITVTYPNGGEILTGGSYVNITWTHSQTSNNFNLYYSTNNGGSWNTISTYVYTANPNATFSWIVPNITSSNCLIRIVDAYNSSVADTSNATFSINGTPPNCAINYTPANNASNVGLTPTLSWSSGGGSPTGYDVYFGTSSNPPLVSSNQGSSSYYPGTLQPNTTYYWRIVPRNANGIASGCQTLSFTTGNPNLTLIQPNGGEIINGLSTYQIQWSASLVSNYVSIYYSINNGSTWNTITTFYYHNNGGSYSWSVPNTPSTQCLVRIVDSYNSSYADTSNATFTINPAPPSITVNYPNGGNNLNVNQTYNITWSAVSVSNVKIEYTYDNGNTWNTIVSGVPASPSSYAWTVPNTPSTLCRIKISDVNNPSVYDESNSNFTINNPSITVTTPNGGQTWTGGTYQYIYWTSSGVSNYVKIEYSANNGNTWNTVTNYTNNTGSYNWYVPNISSNQCLIRISDYYNGSIFDVSNNTFTIQQAPPSITVSYPNGGQNLSVNNSYYINWNSLSVNFVNIEYSINNGSTWLPVANNINANNGTYLWTVPNTPSNQCLIKIYDSSNPSVFDVSNSVFSIVVPTITVTNPNGGQTYTALTNQTITWTSSYLSSYVRIEYSINNGATWTTIASSAYNSGSYSWLVPNTPSTSCLIRVKDYYNTTYADVSDNVFTIVAPPPTIVVTAPNGGEFYGIGNSYYITWNSSGISNVKIEYTTNNGSTWNTIVNSVPASNGSYLWTVPNTPSQSCRVRISDVNNSSTSDLSNSLFTILQPYITVLSPNTSVTFNAGSTYNINWDALGNSNYVNIKLSIDSGATWTTIANATFNTGQYVWTVPNTPSNLCLIKIEDFYNNSVADTSDQTFTINGLPASIILTAPNGGQTLAVNSNYTITWNSQSISNVKLEYSINNGSTWTTIANSVAANNGSYVWNVPATPSQQCLVRVSDASNPNVADISNNTFTIASPYLSVTSPNGGESYNVGSYTYITWNSLGVSNVKIEFSSNNGSTWQTVVNNLSNYNYYYWQIPNSVSTSCLIRVIDLAQNSTLIDTSNNVFSIVNPSPALTLNNPNGGQVWTVGTYQYITWSSVAVNNVKIEYSTNNGTSWNTIVNSYPATNGFYYWNIPNTPSNQCLVRISDASNSSLNDISNNQFSIDSSTPSITITSPNGGEVWYVNSYQLITWNATNISSVNIQYSTNGGSTWTNIQSNYTGNSYYWNIPNTPSTQCLVRVFNNSVGDTSNAVFEIATPTVTTNTIHVDSISPIAFCKGDTIAVYFTSSGTFLSNNTFTAQLSDVNGNFNSPIAIGSVVSATAGSDVIQATIPSYVANGSQYRIRVVSSNYPSTTTDNGVDISITGPQFDFAADATVKYLPNGATNFTYLGSLANVQSYTWNFGDGNTSNLLNPTHNYTNIGYYNVQLEVVDSNGCSVTNTKPNYMRIERLFNNLDIAPGTTVDINSVYFVNDSVGIITLNNGVVYITYNAGTSWNLSNTGLNSPLFGSYYLNGNWYIVGANGVICISTNNGQTWTPYYTGIFENLYSTYFAAGNNGYAVGTNGTICYYNGSSWTAQNSNSGNNLNSVTINGNDVFAVGDNSTILRKQGSGSWQNLNVNAPTNLRSISFANSNRGYAVGDNGIILITNDGGNTWNVTLSGVDVHFTSIATNNNDSAWAVSNSGIIYLTNDGGNTWERYSIGSEDDLNGISYPKANNTNNRGYVVGKGGVARLFGNSSQDTTSTGGGSAINEIMNKPVSEIKIYPNPANQFINLSINDLQECNIIVKISDVNGKPVYSGKFNANDNFTHQFDVSNYASGIYFIHIDTCKSSTVHKFIIAK
ncbi:MAG: YCF48-related protein [Bacteroidia bacterium]